LGVVFLVDFLELIFEDEGGFLAEFCRFLAGVTKRRKNSRFSQRRVEIWLEKRSGFL
jgi:hypothetical protein